MSSSDVPSQTISVSIEDHRQGSEAGTANSDGKHRSRVILELIVGSKVTAIGVLEASKGLGRTISIFDSAGRVISTETNGILQKVRVSPQYIQRSLKISAKIRAYVILCELADMPGI